MALFGGKHQSWKMSSSESNWFWKHVFLIYIVQQFKAWTFIIKTLFGKMRKLLFVDSGAVVPLTILLQKWIWVHKYKLIFIKVKNPTI